MTKPGDPEKGKAAEQEQAEADAADAKEAVAQEAAAHQAADAPDADAGTDEPGASPAEGTAAEVTGVGKDAAAAALREGSSEPEAQGDVGAGDAADEPVSEAEKPQVETAAVEETEGAGESVAADAAADEPESDAEAAEVETEADLAKTDEPEPDAAEEATPAGRRRGRRGRRGRGGATAEQEAAEPVTPAPAPARRAPARREGERVVVRAQAKYVRTSARKARLVCDHIRGKSVQEARAILAHTPRAAARDWSKLLESAIANAEHNHELIGDDLRVFAVTADEGPTLKRFRPRAMGRATRIRKRTSHLTITLTPKE